MPHKISWTPTPAMLALNFQATMPSNYKEQWIADVKRIPANSVLFEVSGLDNPVETNGKEVAIGQL